MPGKREARGARRQIWWLAGLVAVIGIGVPAFLLKPVQGPHRDLTLVGDVTRGKYDILLSGCASCHTAHTSEAAGYLAGGDPLDTPFGTFYPPNITPDKQTGIGNWTLAQFSDALSNGDSPHGNLYPVFPYNDLTLMSDQEVVDLYAAIMAAAPITHEAPAHEIPFPFNVRLLVSAWKNLFFDPHRYRNDPAHSAAWNRGAYLANGPTHCVACHSPINVLGAVKRGEAFTGNSAGGTGGKAPPLTPLALVQDGFDVDTLAETLRTRVTPNAGRVGDEMALVIDDETSSWTEADRRAVATYLLDID
ncbi:MAG: c-type cytochrome [Cypionkella sp.]